MGALLSLPACLAFGAFGGHIFVTVNTSNAIEEGLGHPKKPLEFCVEDNLHPKIRN